MRQSARSSKAIAAQKFEWIEAVASDPKLSAQCCRIAMLLLKHFNRDLGEAWPSHDTLAKRPELTARTVGTALRTLESKGYLQVRRTKRGITNRYKIGFPNGYRRLRNRRSSQLADLGRPAGNNRYPTKEPIFLQTLENNNSPLPPDKVPASQSAEVRAFVREGAVELVRTLRAKSSSTKGSRYA
ncbi:helix-turn-helix domain-containing protein [uncultured Brevundimonas sp.]|uniref:helix-turn-helix domain-containing protein n=1 Tax=uncultured Brevundimonas sp. TaxID=213418 RepID=UPI0026072FB9|nr:helix-turn-helix domain-containing protein [uncultured Brevundimonas sp.]